MRRVMGVCLFMVLLLIQTGHSRAAGDPLVILGCVEDAASLAQIQDMHPKLDVLIVEKSSEKKQTEALKTLSEAGYGAVSSLQLPAVSGSRLTEKSLESRWMTETNIAKIASAIRRRQPESIWFYSENETMHAILGGMIKECASAASNPAIRYQKQKTDEYVWQTDDILDLRSGTHEAMVYPDWKETYLEKYGEKREPVFDDLPETDEDGFLLEGEYVCSGGDDGVWAYISTDLRIVITQQSIKGLTWFEADIQRKPEGDALHIVQSASGRGMKPDQLAKSEQLVFGINADYYQYRIQYNRLAGLIIRNRKVVQDFSGTTTGTLLPPLDTLMLNEEGLFQVDTAGALNAQRALNSGARDVLAFGPILVRDGRMRMLLTKTRANLEPRTAIGQIGENHYLAVVVEGRLKASKGISLNELRNLMALRGCLDAINLDGGHTSVLLFMGERLNTIGSLNGEGTSAPRNMSELLGIGVSSLVQDRQ